MSVTAARLGQSSITLDWSNLARVPASSTTPSYGPDKVQLAEAWGKLKTQYERGDVGFYQSPIDPKMSQIGETLQLAESLLKQDRFTDCLFLGIGGSSLGPISLLSALQDRRKNKLRFHFMENPDPQEWSSTIRELHPDSTLVCAVTKSGTTFETIAQFLLSLEWLGKERWQSHVVAITDPERGDLKRFARENHIPTLHIAPAMGGRFSIFTPVGLFAAAMAGLNAQEFLQGAQTVRDYVEKTPLEKNPLFILGHDLLRHYQKRPIHVCMPYSTRLKSLSAWFVQLWAESLGKDGKGFTPIAAMGATDQHSILQLLRDGPDDKVTLFMTVDQVPDPVPIPKALKTLPVSNLTRGSGGGFPSFAMLEGHSLHELLQIEYRATSLVLTKKSRPHVTFQLDRLDEKSMGAIYFAFSVMTAMTGVLWGVNPFDQPGVEEGKIYTRDSLSKSDRSSDSFDDNSAVARLRRDT